ncbi:hypothetical protein BYI23_D001650 (plasmid) [Burkholderia sp. YI23]|nr:hypothetical protein BYI23_D001650 [Burkholderia sp. YI23]
MEILSVIRDAGIAGAPLQYEWDVEVSRSITYPLEEEHPRLARAFELISDRAALALAMASAEWVAQRFEGIIDIGDALRRIEAGYAAVIDPRLATLPTPDEPFPDELQDAHGPLKLARMIITTAFEYMKDGEGVVDESLSMALLARHVCPQRKKYDAWLSAVLKRAAKHYPYVEDEPPEHQSPVPREFFDLAPDWTPAHDTTELRAFLASLDPARNPYLIADEVLRAQRDPASVPPQKP